MSDINPWHIAILSAFIAGALFLFYRRITWGRMDQSFRQDGPEHHQLKGRVPTGSGIILVILLFLAGAIAFPWATEGVPSARLGIYVCWAAGLIGLLGWVDDRTKVRQGSTGLRARYKFPVMIVIGLGLLYFISTYFTELRTLDISAHLQPWPVYAPWWLFYPVGLFVWLGALNGANFTDGLDGLLSLTTLVVLAGAFFTLLDGVEPLSLPAAVGFGVLCAFLVFNWKPALLYMGDSGSLAIGGLVAGLFLARGWWLFLGLAAVVWVIEVASVMLQIGIYRLSGRRKRILLMSPLHHHFELAGWGERRTVFVFFGLQALGCLDAYVWLRYGVAWGVGGLLLLVAILAFLLAKYHTRVR